MGEISSGSDPALSKVARYFFRKLIFYDKMKLLALHLRSFLEYGYVRGLALPELTAGLSLADADFSDQSCLIEVEDYYAVLERIHRQLGDDHLGLRVGEFLNLNALGLIYRISREATTIEEAIYYLQNFVQSTFPLITLQPHLGGTVNRLEVSIPTDRNRLNRFTLESLLVVMAKELRMMSRDDLSLRLYSPFCSDEYPSDFQYGASYRMEFSPVNLEASLRTLDRAQLNYLVPAYLTLIQGLKNENDLQNKVKIAALNLARPSLPNLAEVASCFHLTPRTFQRRLARERLTFREIADDLKKQLSTLLLHHRDYSIADVSYLLDYSEPAAFVHAFNKWYGYPPSTLRA